MKLTKKIFIGILIIVIGSILVFLEITYNTYLADKNPDKNFILMNGTDLRAVLSEQVRLRQLLKGKLAALNFNAEPFAPVSQLV